MFKVGDKVRSLIDSYTRTEGKIYTITDVDSIADMTHVCFIGDDGNRSYSYRINTFELVKDDVKTRTEEIDVWVQDHDDIYDIVVYHIEDVEIDEAFIKSRGLLKGKLIVDIPEKTVTITESEFDRKWDDTIRYSQESPTREMFKKALGF